MIDEIANIESDELLDVQTVRKEAKCGQTKAYSLFNSGEIRAVKKGRRTYVWRSELQRYLRSLPAYTSKSRGV